MGDFTKQLLKALEQEDREKEIFMMRDKTPLAVRDAYGKGLNTHINENYDINKPEDIKKLWKPNQAIESAKIVSSDKNTLGVGADASFLPNKNTIYVPKGSNPRDIADSIAHELGHSKNYGDKSLAGKYVQELSEKNNDELEKMFSKENISKYKKTLGLSNSEKVLDNHHLGSTFFERGALSKLQKGGKLVLSALAPLAKATGIGAMGLAAAGIGNKAMAGDFKGATGDAGELAYEVATPAVLSAASPTLMGNSELPEEEMEERNKFNRARAMQQLAKAKEIN